MLTVTFTYIATETDKPPECASIAIQCDLLAAPPLQKLAPSVPHVLPSLDEMEQEDTDIDVDMDASFTCSQGDYTTEYVHVYTL